MFKSAVEKASAELTRLRELRVSLDSCSQKARSELEELKAGLAGFDLAAMLDDGSNGAAKSSATTRRGRIRELEDEIETCLGTERPLLEKLQSAMRAVNTARADESASRPRSSKRSCRRTRTRATVSGHCSKLMSNVPTPRK